MHLVMHFIQDIDLVISHVDPSALLQSVVAVFSGRPGPLISDSPKAVCQTFCPAISLVSVPDPATGYKVH